MNRIEAVVEGVEGETVLDLGAVQHDADKHSNDDWLHDALVDEFGRVIGVDILEDDVKKLNELGYEMMQANVTSMDLAIEADTVVAGELIEHVDNPGQMLGRVRRHLKPGGAFIITTPNPWVIGHIARLLTIGLQVNDGHVAWYGPVTLKQLLSRYGFAVEESKPVGPRLWGVATPFQLLGIDRLGRSTWYVKARKT